MTSKDDLVASVLASVLSSIDKRADDLAAGATDPLIRLQMRARAHVEIAVESPLGRLIVSSIDAMNDNPAAAALLRNHEDPARALLNEAKALGMLRDISVVTATKLLYGALNSIPRWYRPEEGGLVSILDQTWSIFVMGVVSQDNRPSASQ